MVKDGELARRGAGDRLDRPGAGPGIRITVVTNFSKIFFKSNINAD